MNRSSTMVGWTLLLGIAAGSAVKADPPVITTPTSEHFNGISYAPDGQFGVAVGNAGVIVHFGPVVDSIEVVPSGTTADLHDVFVVDQNTAVASGFDDVADAGFLLLWDGASWTRHDSSGWGLPILPVWESPEKDVVMFNFYGGGGPFDYRGAFDPVAGEFLPGAYAGPLDLAFCGHSNDIKLINERGDTAVVGNDRAVIQLEGNPVEYSNPSPLSLSAAWIAPASCQQGPLVPTSAVGINSFNDIWRLEGDSWTRIQDVPSDQTLVWVSGVGFEDTYAVGYKDSIDSPGSNQGVIWHCGDSSCSDVTDTLFPGGEIPGLTDIGMTYSHQDCVHVGGFEDDDSAESNNCIQPAESCVVSGFPGDCMTARVSAEDGLIVVLDNAVVPAAITDVRVNLYRSMIDNGVDPVVHVLDATITNDGPATANSVGLRIYVDTSVAVTSVDCGSPINELDLPPGLVLYHKVVTSLPANTVSNCEFHSDAPLTASISAIAESPADRDLGNNRLYCTASEQICDRR